MRGAAIIILCAIITLIVYIMLKKSRPRSGKVRRYFSYYFCRRSGMHWPATLSLKADLPPRRRGDVRNCRGTILVTYRTVLNFKHAHLVFYCCPFRCQHIVIDREYRHIFTLSVLIRVIFSFSYRNSVGHSSVSTFSASTKHCTQISIIFNFLNVSHTLFYPPDTLWSFLCST